MKTPEEIWNELKQLSKKESDSGWPQGIEAIKILTDWGKELCEEQKRIIAIDGYNYPEGSVGYLSLMDAPLPNILKD